LAEKRLLLLGLSFRRKKDEGMLPAIERFDGLFFRVARKYLSSAKDIEVAVMIDDLTLVEGSAKMTYVKPEGEQWGKQTFSKELVRKAKVKNESFLAKKLKNKKYSEIFVSMGKKYAEALPDLSSYNVKIVFPTTGGPGPKAQALKEWIVMRE